MSESEPRAAVEDVRAELRRLGYLDSGLDRFVLGSIGPASAWRASLGSAWRVGLAGGALAACALVLLAVVVERRLLREPADLVVLALYLWCLSALVVGLLAFLSGLIVAKLESRLGRGSHPRLARNVGFVAGLLALSYVVFWWRSHTLEASWPTQVGVLVVGLGLSLALGRFGSLAAVAVTSAVGHASELPQEHLTRQLAPLLLTAGLLLAAAVASSSWRGARTPHAPDYAVVPTGLRVHVFAIDGLEARFAEQLLARGELPTLAGLGARGRVARLQAEPEQVPAIVWTTLATGRGPEAHGILAIGARRLAGMRTPVPEGTSAMLGRATDLLRLTRVQPASALLRSAKTFWNVASEKGLRVGVVNWWASRPTEPVNGYLVSERAVFKREQGGAPEREVYPPSVWESLPRLGTEGPRARDLDQFHVRAALQLRADQLPDLEAVYLAGLDIMITQEMDVALGDLASLELRLEAIRAHARRVDGWVGELLGGLGPRDVVLVVGDPGRLARRAGPGAQGFAILAGGPISPGAMETISPRDIAPTVLHLLGLPISEELAGAPLERALEAGFRGAHAVRKVETYGGRAASAQRDSPFDAQMLDELRSLGYVQ